MSSMTAEVGTRLRMVRRAHRLSQRRLAQISGVSHSIVSQIEKGQTNPSVGLLHRVLSGIPMSLGEFFMLEVPADSQIFYRQGDLLQIAEGAVTLYQVGANLANRRIQMLYEVYEPGADTGETLLTHDAEETGIVIQGQLEITVGDQTTVLSPGEAYYYDSRIPHKMRNAGSEVCIVVSACTPPSF